MILYVLLPIMTVQIVLLGRVMRKAILRRRKINLRVGEVQKIIPEIKTHPNPHLADLLWKMGNELNEDDDYYLRLVGVCLKNYYTVLGQEFDKKQLHNPDFISRTQSAMTKLEMAFRQDSKMKLAECLFDLSRILFEYPSAQEDKSASMDLERALNRGVALLRNRGKIVRSSPEFDMFRQWDFQRLKIVDPYLRFVFVHTIRWCSQLPFEYRMEGRAFWRKSNELSVAVDKALHHAKERNLLAMYTILACAYSSLFPLRKSVSLSADEIFFKPRTYVDLANERARQILDIIRNPS